jgi:glycosyltransferase involved in cell wall biosynthesis
VWYSLPVRIVVDYRPALRERTGVGEYVHNLVRAYTENPQHSGDEVVLFTSSWKDRPAAGIADELRARLIDRRVPVRALNYGWHRFSWPPIESLAGRAEVVHALHPLLIPATRAAQVVTIHDLFFLTNPERTTAEIRRDYAVLAPRHARRADAIVVPSRYTAALVTGTFSVPAERVFICSPGPPVWRELGRRPNVPGEGYILFMGTLEPRKNVGALLDAYERLLARGTAVPPLVLAGRASQDAAPWLERLRRAPLAGHARHLGYVPADERERVYAGARLLVQPSRDEGFGIPVLEAMSAGVPVVAANRGSLPEVLGDAGPLVDPDDAQAFEHALRRVIDDQAFATMCAERGLARARQFSWSAAASNARNAYEYAVARKTGGRRFPKRDGGFQKGTEVTGSDGGAG